MVTILIWLRMVNPIFGFALFWDNHMVNDMEEQAIVHINIKHRDRCIHGKSEFKGFHFSRIPRIIDISTADIPFNCNIKESKNLIETLSNNLESPVKEKTLLLERIVYKLYI